ncbi:MAG TPA: S46 family peptidase, partial [Gammaproteobacteria bacterium]
MPTHSLISFAAGIVVLAASTAAADEGMWTFDNFPSDLVRERYGVRIDDAWLERVRLGTVRLSGCTGSFVSPNGLIL